VGKVILRGVTLGWYMLQVSVNRYAYAMCVVEVGNAYIGLIYPLSPFRYILLNIEKQC